MFFSLLAIFGFTRSNMIILRILQLILILLIISLIVAGIAFIAAYSYVWDFVTYWFLLQITAFHFERQSIQWLVNFIQKNYQCCGAKSKFDWRENSMFHCSDKTGKICPLPESCCKPIVFHSLSGGNLTHVGYTSIYDIYNTKINSNVNAKTLDRVRRSPIPAPQSTLLQNIDKLLENNQVLLPDNPELTLESSFENKVICGYSILSPNMTDSFVHPHGCATAIRVKWHNWPSLSLFFFMSLWIIIIIELFTIRIILKNYNVLKQVEKKIIKNGLDGINLIGIRGQLNDEMRAELDATTPTPAAIQQPTEDTIKRTNKDQPDPMAMKGTSIIPINADNLTVRDRYMIMRKEEERKKIEKEAKKLAKRKSKSLKIFGKNKNTKDTMSKTNTLETATYNTSGQLSRDNLVLNVDVHEL